MYPLLVATTVGTSSLCLRYLSSYSAGFNSLSELQTHPRWSACQGVFLGELDLQPKSFALYLEFSNAILILDGAVWALLDTLGQKLCLVSSIVYLAQNRGFCEFFHGSWALLLSYGKQHPDWLLSLEASSSNLNKVKLLRNKLYWNPLFVQLDQWGTG